MKGWILVDVYAWRLYGLEDKLKHNLRSLADVVGSDIQKFINDLDISALLKRNSVGFVCIGISLVLHIGRLVQYL